MRVPTLSLPILLAVLFISLKLSHVVAWSWLWVLSPIWGIAAFYFFCMLAIVICAGTKRWK